MLEKLLQWLWKHPHHCPDCHMNWSHLAPLCLYYPDDMQCPRCDEISWWWA